MTDRPKATARRPRRIRPDSQAPARRPQRALETVQQGLQAYADRGVFRGFSERPAQRGRHRFRFLYSTRRPIDLVFEPVRGTLTFTNLLPKVPARSMLFEDLRRFIEGRTSVKLPPHRAIDATRMAVECLRAHGGVSVRLTVRPGHEDYGVNRAVNLMHEVFLRLNASFPEYLWEQFGAQQE